MHLLSLLIKHLLHCFISTGCFEIKSCRVESSGIFGVFTRDIDVRRNTLESFHCSEGLKKFAAESCSPAGATM